MLIESFIEQILFVVVLYENTPQQSGAFVGLQELDRQYPGRVTLYLYDNSINAVNGFESAERDVNLFVCIDNVNVIYRHDPSNSGVSKAYNDGFEEAKKRDKNWLILLDQDTEFHPALLVCFREATKTFPEEVVFAPVLKDRLGIVSPFRWRFGRGFRLQTPAPRLPLSSYRFLNSGLLVKITAFAQAVGYDEEIPLYFSDIAFGSRLEKAIQHFVVVDFELKHGFSTTENVTLTSALIRFGYYCRGAKAMAKKYTLPFLIVNAFLRGAKLCYQYKTLSFVKHFARIF